MQGSFKNEKGFTFTELLFVAVISLVVIGAIVAAWAFTQKVWTAERERTLLRVDLVKALETIKSDLRLSDLNNMSFYPSGGEPYTAISLPVAKADANGFFTLDAEDNIEWDKTIIYHLYTGAGGVKTLRRTVFDPRDNTMTDSDRYTQLENVVTTGQGSGTGYTTDTEFLENLDTFEVSSLSTIIDFYVDSATPVRSDKIIFGWARLNDGDHTFRLEVTGKNASSSGYDIGIDSMMIEPSGSRREIEYYNSAGLLTASGGSASRVYDPAWSNKNYLEFGASAAGDYIEFTDHYDLWRESAFENVALDNAAITGEEVRIAVDVPEDDEEGEITWFASQETGDSQSQGRDGSIPWGVNPGVVVRTYVSSANITEGGDLVRVNFRTCQGAPLLIERAYITRKDDFSSNDYDGYGNLDPSGRTVEEYHRHQQLFFKDAYDYDGDMDTDEITPMAWIPADSSTSTELWSVWTAFPLAKTVSGSDVDYLLTFYVSDAASTGCKYWQGASTVSYYLTGDSYTQAQLIEAAGTPAWGANSFLPDGNSSNIFANASIDSGKTSGTMTSQVFDTTLRTPDYNTITCSEYTTAGSSITLKARSSSNETMTGASDWDLIGSSSINGNNRYVQSRAELEAGISWETPSSALSYADYVTGQLSDGNDYTFPYSAGVPYIAEVTSPEIDDVTVSWHPSDERICAITGYIAKKDDYGRAKITIDGSDIIKVLSVYVKVSKDVQGRTIEEKNYVDIHPRNTGK